jgi:hypothetical protein
MRYLFGKSTFVMEHSLHLPVDYITFKATLLFYFAKPVLHGRFKIIKAVPVTLNSFPLQINLSFSYDVETSW